MCKQAIKYSLDEENPPKLTAKQQAELDALAALPDENIDYSDIPQTTDEAWKVAKIGKFYKPFKKQVTVRIDADVLAWLKSGGSGYQTRLNHELRDALKRAIENAA
jgi:uncharacterized protein (DUF4415 family)